MATTKPRFGGVSNMDTRKFHSSITDTSMASEVRDSFAHQTDLSHWHEGESPTAGKEQTADSLYDKAGSCENYSNPDIKESASHGRKKVCEIPTNARDTELNFDNLLKVFDTLKIVASPVPYLARGETRRKNTESCIEQNVLYCKNLFLKDRQNNFYFVICLKEDTMDLKVLKQQLGANRNLSFADADSLRNLLHLMPGEVTPLALMHKTAQDVKIGIHQKIVESSKSKSNIKFAFHPLRGDLQVNISYKDLIVFLEYFERPFQILPEKSGVNSNKIVGKDKSKPRLSEGLNTACLLQLRSSSGTSDKLHSENFECAAISKGTKPPIKPLDNTQPQEWRQTEAEARNDDIVHFTSGVETGPYNSGTIIDISKENSVPAKNVEMGLESEHQRSEVDCDKVTGSSSVNETQCQFYKLRRKGKLSSYVRKNETGRNEKSSHTSPECKALDLENEEKDTEQPLSNETFTLLPEIENFYSSLTDADIRYKEIDFSNKTGMDFIEPSIGCRSFLLKDRRDNFFFIISHELYELDFGRLKAALKPKKKLMVANPAEVISVLGTDPSKITPFSVLTMCNPKPQTFFTSKVISPKLVFCIQHPFAPSRRITITSGELQKYLDSLGISFSVVEEKYWPPRYDRPFTQFETIDDTQRQACETNSNVSYESRSMPTMPTNDDADQFEDVSAFSFGNYFFSRFNATSVMETIVKVASYTACAFPEYGLSPSTLSLTIFSQSNTESFHDDNSVDHISEEDSHDDPKSVISGQAENGLNLTQETEGSAHTFDVSEKENQEIDQLLPRYLGTYEDFHSITNDKDLENHLKRFGINFCIQKTQHLQNPHIGIENDRGTEKDPENRVIDEDAIVEHCAIMHLLDNTNGQTFLVVAATDEFPISVRRFCRKLRLRGHLEIISEPKRQPNNIAPGNHEISEDTESNMLLFILALSSAKERNTHIVCSDSDDDARTEPSAPQRSKVTVVMTTTLYIDPETVMEFTVGSQSSPSRLRMTSAEFERYARAVGFDVLYY